MRFKLFQNIKRLRIVHDVCPLPGFPSYDGHAWKGAASTSAFPIITHRNGYTEIVAKNKIFAWHRTFTHDLHVPNLQAAALLHLHEWIPPTYTKKTPGFLPFSFHHFHAVAKVTNNAHLLWSNQARRHLSHAQKNSRLFVRSGTIEEVRALMPYSQVPKSLHSTFLNLANRHITAHPNDVEITVAEIDHAPVAAFIAGYCHEVKESIYLVGCATKTGAQAHAMVALIHHWFERCKDRSMIHANFGDIVGPHPFPFDDMIGYSNFKTHFNVHRVWLPGSRWRITLSPKPFRDPSF